MREGRRTGRKGSIRRLRRIVFLARVAMTVTACGKEPEPELMDEAGTVTGWEWRFGVDVDLSREDWLAIDRNGAIRHEPPTGWDLRIVWGGTACQVAPMVRLTGSSQMIEAVTVNNGPQVLPPGESCGDALVAHALDIKASPAPQGEIDVSGEEWREE